MASRILEHSRNENNSLSFSNKDLHILLYRLRLKYSSSDSNLYSGYSDGSLCFTASLNNYMNHASEYWYITSTFANDDTIKNSSET